MLQTLDCLISYNFLYHLIYRQPDFSLHRLGYIIMTKYSSFLSLLYLKKVIRLPKDTSLTRQSNMQHVDGICATLFAYSLNFNLWHLKGMPAILSLLSGTSKDTLHILTGFFNPPDVHETCTKHTIKPRNALHIQILIRVHIQSSSGLDCLPAD